MAARKKQEECIYNWGQLAPVAAADGGPAAPRVKTYNVSAPPASVPRRMHEDSSQVESILKPVRGIRDAQRHAGITPTNHSRHNIQAVKEQSRINALQKAQQKDDRIIAAHTAARSKGTATGGRQAAGYTAAAAAGRQQPSRSSSLGSSGGGADISAARDFVEENKLAAAAAAARRHIKAESKAAAGAGEFLHKSEYGQVPTYLLERKLQLAQEHEALMAAKAAAAIPPGLRVMPECERLETLGLLQQNRQEVEAKLSALSITNETHRMKRHKEELERRLAEIEDARRIFSRPNVLVQANT